MESARLHGSKDTAVPSCCRQGDYYHDPCDGPLVHGVSYLQIHVCTGHRYEGKS
jgi:hypothetical protein